MSLKLDVLTVLWDVVDQIDFQVWFIGEFLLITIVVRQQKFTIYFGIDSAVKSKIRCIFLNGTIVQIWVIQQSQSVIDVDPEGWAILKTKQSLNSLPKVWESSHFVMVCLWIASEVPNTSFVAITFRKPDLVFIKKRLDENWILNLPPRFSVAFTLIVWRHTGELSGFSGEHVIRVIYPITGRVIDGH